MKVSAGHCPRCFGRHGVRSAMFSSQLPYRELTGVGSTKPRRPGETLAFGALSSAEIDQRGRIAAG